MSSTCSALRFRLHCSACDDKANGHRHFAPSCAARVFVSCAARATRLRVNATVEADADAKAIGGGRRLSAVAREWSN